MSKYTLGYLPGNIGFTVSSQCVNSRHMSHKEVLDVVKGILGMPTAKKLDQASFEAYGGIRLTDTEGREIFKIRDPHPEIKKWLARTPPTKIINFEKNAPKGKSASRHPFAFAA